MQSQATNSQKGVKYRRTCWKPVGINRDSNERPNGNLNKEEKNERDGEQTSCITLSLQSFSIKNGQELQLKRITGGLKMESACKPGPVEDSHSSGMHVTVHL